MRELVFFLEEPSAEAMLQGLLRKLISAEVCVRFVVFEGKQDLEKQIGKRIRGYLVPHALFVVLRDKDSEDCLKVKERLKEKCIAAGKPSALIRIACHELESWYLGDLTAVEAGLRISGLAAMQNRRPYNDPDGLPFPALRLQSIAPSYQKVGGSRAIGPHLDFYKNSSASFNAFINGVQRLLAGK